MDTLSDEMLVEILTKMNLTEISHFFLTCKKISSFDEETLWKQLTKMRFPKYYSYKSDLMTWKQICIACTYPMISRCNTKKYLGHKQVETNEYVGEYVGNAQPHGIGMFIEEKRVIVGNFTNLVVNGYGEIFYFSGNKYQGNFIDNKITGQGRTESNIGNIGEGQFKNGVMRKGIYRFSNGNVYEGSLNKRAQFEGYGIYKWKNGCKYIGNWKDGKKWDMGTSIFSTGIIYIGKYEDKRNGEGKLYWPNGDIFEGTWKNSKRCGKGVFTEYATGKKYEQIWIDDIEKYEMMLPERFPSSQ